MYTSIMERTQIYLSTEQRERLSATGRRRGRAMADLIREAIDCYLAAQAQDDDDKDADALLRLIGAGEGLDPARDVSKDHHRYLRGAEKRKRP